MTIPLHLFTGPHEDAQRAYAAIFHPPSPRGQSRNADSVLYAAWRTRLGWRSLPDPSRARLPLGGDVAVTMSDPAEGQRVFDALAEGGQVERPYEASAWSPGFGRLTDRFGTHWMVDAMPPPRGGA